MFLWGKYFAVSHVVIMELSLDFSFFFCSLVLLFPFSGLERKCAAVPHNDLVLQSVREGPENLLMAVAWQYPFSPYKSWQGKTHPYDFTPTFSQWLICEDNIQKSTSTLKPQSFFNFSIKDREDF